MAVSLVYIARFTLGGYLVSGHHGDRAGGGRSPLLEHPPHACTH